MCMSSNSVGDSRHFQGMNFHSLPEACLKANAKRREAGNVFCQEAAESVAGCAGTLAEAAAAVGADGRNQALKAKQQSRSCNAHGARAGGGSPKLLKAPNKT